LEYRAGSGTALPHPAGEGLEDSANANRESELQYATLTSRFAVFCLGRFFVELVCEVPGAYDGSITCAPEFIVKGVMAKADVNGFVENVAQRPVN
jgi:hypothetical protein